MPVDDILRKDRGLELLLPNGSRAYFNYYWLRDNSPGSFDPRTRERTYDIFSEVSRPVAESATTANGELKIVWQGSGHATTHQLVVPA